MDYVLHQVVNTRNLGWMGLEERDEVLGKDTIDLDLYSVVYEGEVEDGLDTEAEVMAVLEFLFQEFNINPPVDYRGRSMSVSNLVHLGDRFFYCDSCGFKEVTDRVYSSSEVELNCSSVSPGGERC